MSIVESYTYRKVKYKKTKQPNFCQPDITNINNLVYIIIYIYGIYSIYVHILYTYIAIVSTIVL